MFFMIFINDLDDINSSGPIADGNADVMMVYADKHLPTLIRYAVYLY